ncbi:MAG: PKD domain-containing protein [Saprospiraceae bacterium]|nr:PKD domain-containing protein [Saprospiraceae bacterium]
MKKLLYCFFFGITSLVGQNLVLDFITVSHPEFQNKDNSGTQFYQLNRQFLDQMENKSENLSISVSIGSNQSFKFSAQKHSVFSDHLAIQVSSSPNVSTFFTVTGTLYKIDSNSSFNEGLISIGAECLYMWWRIGEEQFILEPLHLSLDSIHGPLYVLRKPVAFLKEAFCNHPNSPTLNGLSDLIHKTVTNSQNDSCVSTQMACALDWSFVKTMRNVDLAIQHLEFTMGMVEQQYSGWFDKDIKFELKDLFISNCEDCDPPTWKSEKNSVKLLQNFIDWGENNGFGNQANHHLAFLMTYRFLTDVVSVQSFPSRVCAKSKYFIQQSLKNVSADKYLTAHEIAHFFGALHDTDSAGFIMSATPNLGLPIPTQWSSRSIEAINLFLKSDTCLLSCQPLSEAPVPIFSAHIYEHCGPVTIQINDYSLKSPTEWEWSFPGGTPVQSSERHPKVLYTQTGTYDVTLKVSNSKGSNTRTESHYITIHSLPEAEFQTNTNGLMVQFTNLTKNATNYYWNFGDGESSTLTSPIHTYKADGLYKIQLIAFNLYCSDTLETEVTIIMNTSIQHYHETGLKIHPNPGNGFIQIQIPSSSQFTLKVYSFGGKEVFEEQLKEDKNFIQFPEFLHNGIYRLVFVSKEMKPVHLNYLLLK